MADEQPRSSLSFEDFIEVATTAALRAQKNNKIRKPGPIWVGIIIRDYDDVLPIGNPQQEI